MVEIAFAAGDKRRVVLVIGGQAHPDSDEPYDRDWLTARAEVEVDGFAGAAAGQIRHGELVSFRDALGQLNASLRGRARFETIEGWLALTLEGDGLGHVAVAGQLRDPQTGAQSLSFRFEIDQTALAAPLASLRRATTPG